ncbi:MAG: hypothetical protein JOZ61_00150 [Verrucomicrobia bacterium]|nr:hypothetical protein [Verrucomicrobiota bacterium]
MDNNLDLLKAKMNRQPFQSFVIEFVSGHRILIDTDTEIYFPEKRPGLVTTFTAGGLMQQFESDSIARLIDADVTEWPQ